MDDVTRTETMKFLEMMENLKLLNIYLDEEGKDAFETLKNKPDTSSWRKLAGIVLAQLILFNRRRAGEAERIEISQYLQGLKVGGEVQEDIYSSLSRFEKKLVETLNRVEIRGKRGRRVPILFTNAQKSRIDLLIQTRGKCDIDKKNIYVFARCGQSTTPLRSSDILRKFAKECGAKNPEHLTSTSLRKHIATVSQILSLKENEMDALAGFLGHDIRVHREFYRLP
ncbi:hypothetical protein LOTGIDRAFT_163215 [Lottia gigantea]|uniref:Tyr recombinase domain-containing protein n=1 Tax=Lottia gigantea TaxID=225164 RepID=V4AEW3_LOTGI|nr:hypothetical protein LOTGIDRAFT_163215 [Lottia gigantea]ESO91856.1 hypothetical protein LOTGIDRAFT_163215 [Lottia gigantea]